MDFQVKQIVIHELIKGPESPEARLFLSKDLLPVDEQSSDLIERLNLSFEQRSETLQGYFASPEDTLFPGYFQVLVDADFGAEATLHFSRETMQALQLSLQGITGAKGGYLVYSLYQFLGTSYLGIFMIRDAEGIVFEKQDEAAAFRILPTTYLNTERLAMAGRINIDQFLMGNQRCLELIKYARSQKTISEYFQNWMGLDRPESSRELTQTFLEVVNELPLPEKPESHQKMGEDEFRAEVLQFALRNPQKTINIEQFEKEFYGEQPTLRNYAREQEIPLEDTFRYDQQAMKNYYNYRTSADGISLSFNFGHYHRRQIEIEGDTVVIRSEALVQRLLAQLEQYL